MASPCGTVNTVNVGKNVDNQVGRIVKVTDASGTAEMGYGKLGETIWDKKTIASGRVDYDRFGGFGSQIK